MQKNIYFVILDLHTTDRETIIQLFKDWTAYSEKLVDGELVKKDNSNVFCRHGYWRTVGLTPYRLTLTFGVSASFLKKMGLSDKRPKAFRDLPLFQRSSLKKNIRVAICHSGLCRCMAGGLSCSPQSNPQGQKCHHYEVESVRLCCYRRPDVNAS